jgi:hypothetical protein
MAGNRSNHSNRLLQMEQELLALRQKTQSKTPGRAAAQSAVRPGETHKNRRQLPMKPESSTRSPLLEMEQELKAPAPKTKLKQGESRPAPASRARAYDHNEPIELSYNPAYHTAGVRPAPFGTARPSSQAISLPLEFDSPRYYVEPFEEIKTAVNQNAGNILEALPIIPPSPADVLLKATPQPIMPPVIPPGVPNPALKWEELEKKLASGSSLEQAQPMDSDSRAFMNDLRAVMSGQKQVGARELQAPAVPAAAPANASPLPPELEGPHAVFDQMSAGMAYATTYNLGPMALEERFKSFDQSLPAALAGASQPSPPAPLPQGQGEDFLTHLSPTVRGGIPSPQPYPTGQGGTPSPLPSRLAVVNPEELPMPGLQRMDLIEDFSYLSQAASAPTLSGAGWVSQFPTSTSLDDLEPDFRDRVKAFTQALAAAGAAYQVNATRRPKERAYLMHWAWNIARQNYDASQVPAFAGVNINWDHGSQEESRQAAQEMVNAYGIQNLEVAPALASRHIEGKAVDIEICWTGDLAVKTADGATQMISSEPRNHTNAGLIAAANTYGVVHFKDVSKDKVHWSTDGR